MSNYIIYGAARHVEILYLTGQKEGIPVYESHTKLAGADRSTFDKAAEMVRRLEAKP